MENERENELHPPVEIAPEAPPAESKIVDESDTAVEEPGYVPTSEIPVANVPAPAEELVEDHDLAVPAAMNEQTVAEFNQEDGDDEIIQADVRELPLMLDICKRQLDAASLKNIHLQARIQLYESYINTQTKIIDDFSARLRAAGADVDELLAPYAVKTTPPPEGAVAVKEDGGSY